MLARYSISAADVVKPEQLFHMKQRVFSEFHKNLLEVFIAFRFIETKHNLVSAMDGINVKNVQK